jgi:LEA14-like dessication related protein
MKKSVLLFSIVITVLLGIFSCTTPQSLVYKDVKNFRIGKLSLAQPEVGMDIQFYNPNAYGLTLKDANIDVYLNNTYIGKAALSNQFSVPGLDTFNMPVALTADLKSIFPNALNIIFNKEVNVRLQGNVKAGKGVFLNIPINYEGRQKLNIF